MPCKVTEKRAKRQILCHANTMPNKVCQFSRVKMLDGMKADGPGLMGENRPGALLGCAPGRFRSLSGVTC